MIFIRSLLFNVVFYLNVARLLVVAVARLGQPHDAMLGVARMWGRSTLWLLRVICRLDVECRGLEKIPPGGILVAAKHQSAWETIVMATLFPDFTFVVKSELFRLPVFGRCIAKGGMIPVDRGAGKAALADLTVNARKAIAEGRQIIIFPEGTRRAAGAPPRYKPGVAHLYAECDAPCVPVALNSGLYWPRRSFMRFPGKVCLEVLDPIPPGRDREAFFAELQAAIETATARLIAEARHERVTGK